MPSNLKKAMKVTSKSKSMSYPIEISADCLSSVGRFAKSAVGGGLAAVTIVSNKKVFSLYGAEVVGSLKKVGLRAEVILIGDGERHKNMRTAEKILKFLSEKKMTRTDAVVALGGGVVGDVAGFASALHLRGISCIQIPTTLVAMIDSSVGGKTGVNSADGKNLVGVFHQPAGVLIDVSTLSTLESRELTAGFCEAVKHGLLSGRALLKATTEFIDRFPVHMFGSNTRNARFKKELVKLVCAQIEFKRSVVIQDENEDPARSDSKSRKILNLGHTLAHSIERVAGFGRIRHGEAVGIGVVFAAEVSVRAGLLKPADMEHVLNSIASVGWLPSIKRLNGSALLEAFTRDKKNLAGSLQLELLKGIGKPVITDARRIGRKTLVKALETITI